MEKTKMTRKKDMKRFVNVHGYFRGDQKVRQHRRKLPENYVRSLHELADADHEVGGEIDYEPDGGMEMHVERSNSKNQITLHPSENVELIFHTHPIDNEADGRLQRTPSPEDIQIMLEMKDDDNWAIATKHDFLVYKEKPTSVKYSQATMNELQNDYNRIKKMSFSKHLKISDPARQDIAQSEWMSNEWEKLLRHKYRFYVKRFDKDDEVVLYFNKIN